MKPSIEKLSTMFTRLSTVPFSDVDYYANQIEIIFEVSEIEAYELAQQLKETTMKKLQITGFKHVTTTGIARLFQELDLYGTINMLYELTNDQMVSMIMNTPHFNSSTYISELYPSISNSEFDNMIIEIHNEIVDAYTMIIWSYRHMLDSIEINGRTIEYLSSAVDISFDSWEPKTVSIDKLLEHCINTTYIESVHVRLFTYEDGQSYQRFEWTIHEAEEFHVFETMYKTIKKLYPNTVIQIV